MGLRRQVPAPVVSGTIMEAPSVQPTALVAAAAEVRLDDQSANALKLKDHEWQNEAWRHYDINGALRFISNRHAAALSRCSIYVADLDETGDPGKPTENKQASILSSTLFGGAAQKAEAMRTIGLQLYIAGECFAVALGGQGQGGADLWLVCSPKELRKWDGGIQVRKPNAMGEGWFTLRKGKDLLIRIWTPHPRLYNVADSPVRATLPTLRKIERLTQLMFSQIDSRLISAGLLLFREGVDFPQAGTNGKPGGVEGLMELILAAARAQLTGAGTAAGLVPILGTVPGGGDQRGDNIQNAVTHVKFDTPLQAELEKLLDQALRQLAVELDVAPEDLLGQGDANHWSSWQIEESSIKMYIEPPLVRICAAFTEAYLKAALKSLKLDPDKFCLWYDTAPLVVRPNRFEDALQMWEQGLIGDAAMIAAGNFDSTDAPKQPELMAWRAWQIVKLNPAMIGAPTIAKWLGVKPSEIEGLQPPMPQQPELPPGYDQGQGDTGQELPPEAGNMGELPEQPTSQTTPAQRGKRGQALAASGFAMYPACEQIVLRALELAGGRLLDRTQRGLHADVEKSAMHTRIRPDEERVPALLAGAFTHVPVLASHYGTDGAALTALLSGYCRELLIRGRSHDPELLATVLFRANL